MSQIRDKKAHRKHIATMNPINAKSVQLIELHAFAYCLLSVSLSESFDFLKISILHIITMLAVILSTTSLSGIHIRTSLSTTLSIAVSTAARSCALWASFSFCKTASIGAFLSAGNLSPNSFN